ncbi:MAG: hypothetical protein U0992_00855 [Planctomycetaceae bacterium]
MLQRQLSTVGITYSLLGALAFLLAGCSGSSGSSEYEQFKQKEAGLADAIVAAGGTAKKEGRSLGFGKPEGVGWFIDLHGATISEEAIESIVNMRNKDALVFDLNLSGSTITDAQLAKLEEGKVLETVFKLDLSKTAITDAGLDQIDPVHYLMELNVKDSQATKDGTKRLGERKVKDPKTPAIFRNLPKVTQ